MRLATACLALGVVLAAGCGKGSESDEEAGLAECLGDEGLGPSVLRLDLGADRAWIINGTAEIELELAGAGEAGLLVGTGRDGTVAVARSTGLGAEQQAVVHTFSTDGELQWSQDLSGFGVAGIWLGPEGDIAGKTTPPEGGVRVGFAMTQDQVFDLVDHEPLGAPADGFVPVIELGFDSVPTQPGWIAMADQVWTPAEFAPLEVYDVHVVPDQHTIEYVAVGATDFVVARPGQSELVELPIDELPSLDVYRAAAVGDFRLLWSDAATDVFIRVDLADSVAVVVDPSPPAGWSFFDCYGRKAGLDRSGAVLFELRDPARAQIWAYEPDTGDWTALGSPAGLVDDIEVAGLGGVHILRAVAQGMTLCPDATWEDPPTEALVGNSTQLVRLDPPLSVTVPSDGADVWIDAGERCAAYTTATGWEVRALDGDESATFGSPTGTWQWLE